MLTYHLHVTHHAIYISESHLVKYLEVRTADLGSQFPNYTKIFAFSCSKNTTTIYNSFVSNNFHNTAKNGYPA